MVVHASFSSMKGNAKRHQNRIEFAPCLRSNGASPPPPLSLSRDMNCLLDTPETRKESDIQRALITLGSPSFDCELDTSPDRVMLSPASVPQFKANSRTSRAQSKAKEKRQKFFKLLFLYRLHRRRQVKCCPGRPFSVTKRNRKSFWRIVRKLDGKHFKRIYRLTCFQFRVLVGRLRPILDRNKLMAERSSGSIEAEVKLALLLRILAGASYNDLCMIFDIPHSSVYDIFQRTLNALLSVLKMTGLPSETSELKKMALRFKFSRRSGSPLNGCVGALDGIAIKIRKPDKRYHPALYYCRKEFYAIPVQALVDADYRFRCFSALCVGATHNSLSHSISGLGHYLREGKLKKPFWIAADEAYICTQFLLTPFACSQFDRSSLSKYKDSFNFFHSSLRMHVEQAFGMLVARFGILWRPLSFSLSTNTRILLAAMLLHNFCIDNSCSRETVLDTMSHEEKRDSNKAFKKWYRQARRAVFAQHEITSNITRGDRAMRKSVVRKDMVNILRSLRLKRPYGQDRFDSGSEEDD